MLGKFVFFIWWLRRWGCSDGKHRPGSEVACSFHNLVDCVILWLMLNVLVLSVDVVILWLFRLGNERVLGSSLDHLNPLKSFAGPVPSLPRRVPENLNPRLRTSCCPQCKEKFEHELAKLASEFENSSSEAKSESPPRPQLPQWLQSAKLKNDSKATALSQVYFLLD